MKRYSKRQLFACRGHDDVQKKIIARVLSFFCRELKCADDVIFLNFSIHHVVQGSQRWSSHWGSPFELGFRLNVVVQVCMYYPPFPLNQSALRVEGQKHRLFCQSNFGIGSDCCTIRHRVSLQRQSDKLCERDWRGIAATSRRSCAPSGN